MSESEEVTLRKIGGDQDFGRILVQRRTVFPGPGGVIFTKYPIKCAFRQERGAVKGHGFRLFLRHLVIKKLDDFFVITGRYHCPHVAAPYGVISNEKSEGYIYQWADGQETFPWEMLTGDRGLHDPVHLKEWNEFLQSFQAVGIDLGRNVVMPDSRNAQNIIHADGRVEEVSGQFQLNAAWCRIDFDEESAGIDYKKLSEFVNQNSQLWNELGGERYELLCQTTRLLGGGYLTSYGFSWLERLAALYRLSALDHSRLVEQDD